VSPLRYLTTEEVLESVPMAATDSRRTPEELARLGAEIYDQRVRPTLGPGDDSKSVAIDVETGDFEIDADDYTAVTRLRARRPEADMWLERVGRPAAYVMRRRR
jgi:hypothetical protein